MSTATSMATATPSLPGVPLGPNEGKEVFLDPMCFKIPGKVGKYLGSGSFGSVYEFCNPQCDRVLKVMLAPEPDIDEDVRRSPQALRMAENKAWQTLARAAEKEFAIAQMVEKMTAG